MNRHLVFSFLFCWALSTRLTSAFHRSSPALLRPLRLHLQPSATSSPPPPGVNLTLSFQQLRPFLEIAAPFFREDATARNSLLSVGALTLLNSGVSVAFSYISRDFYNALNVRDEALFYEKIELFFAALLVAVPITVLYRFVRKYISFLLYNAIIDERETESVLARSADLSSSRQVLRKPYFLRDGDAEEH